MKPNAAVQVDLDGIWTIYRYHGIEREIWPDAVFTEAVPRFLSLFQEMQIQTTFFVVGIDTTIPEKAEIIRQIANAGHEIANHSYSHFIPFTRLDEKTIEEEICRTQVVLEKLTGARAKGFRAPAYGLDKRVLKVLEKNQFDYDASVFPTRWSKMLQQIEKKKSGAYPPLGNYGGNQFGNAPIMPYHPDGEHPDRKGNLRISEIPVSVVPLVRTPLHRSVAQFFGSWYFRSGVYLNKLSNVPMSLLFHGVELVDSLRDERLPQFKWVTTPFPQRIDELRRMIKILKKSYRIVPTCNLIPRQN